MSIRSYDPETKTAVLAALLEGQSVNAVAKEYGIPSGTVKSWKSRDLGEKVAIVATEKQVEIGDLLVKYMEESLKTLIAQLQIFRDPQWLKIQPASDAAVLHGVQTDKLMRMLEALNRAESTD